MSLINKGNELFLKAKADAAKSAFQGQTADDKVLAELKKIAQASGKNSFTRPYRMGIEAFNDSAAAIASPNYNIEVPKFKYPVSFLKALRVKWTRSTANGIVVVNHETRVYPIIGGGVGLPFFDLLEPTPTAPSPVETAPSVNTQFNLFYYNDNQSNNGFEAGYNILLPEQIGFFFKPIVTGAAYSLPINETDIIRVDLLIEHALTKDFKPS